MPTMYRAPILACALRRLRAVAGTALAGLALAGGAAAATAPAPLPVKSDSNWRNCNNPKRITESYICKDYPDWCIRTDLPLDECSTGSVIDNVQLTHLHYAVDYRTRMDAPAGGCGSCGSAGATVAGAQSRARRPLAFSRMFDHRRLSLHSSYGPGCFSNWDVFIGLNVYDADNQVIKGIEFSDPERGFETRFLQGATPGLFTDAAHNVAAHIQLYSSFNPATMTGTPVASGYSYLGVSHAVLTEHDGSRLVFQMIDVLSDPTPMQEKHYLKQDVAATATTLPAGTVTAFGFFNPSFGQVRRYDNLTIRTSGGTVLYCEKFPLGAGGHPNATQEGWAAFYDNAGITTQALIVGPGSPTAATAVNSSPVNSGDGCLSWGDNVIANRPALFYTAEYRGMTAAQLGSIAWDSRHDDSTTKTLPAVCVNGFWYAPDPVLTAVDFEHTAGSSTWQNHVFNVVSAGAVWKPLTTVRPNEPYPLASTAPVIDTLRMNHERGGRLVRIVDRNDYATVLTYAAGTTGDALWKLATVTDSYGTVGTITYSPTLVSGRHVISGIALPNGQSLTYSYDSVGLTGVGFPDGTSASITRGFDSARNLATVTYHDPGAEGAHRRKTAFLTGQYAYGNTAQNAIPTVGTTIFPSSAQLLRELRNAAGEHVYSSVISGSDRFVFEAGGRLKVFNVGNTTSVKFATTWSTTDGNGDGFLQATEITRTLQASFAAKTFGSNDQLKTRNIPTTRTADNGLSASYTYNAADRITAKTHTQDGTTELWLYNPFNQPLRYKDRLHRVTSWEYDARGNKTKETRGQGLANVADITSALVTFPGETADWEWTYFPSGHANQFLLATSKDANDKVTDYAYDAQDRLTTITEPADVSGGTRAVTTFAYDSAGRLSTVSTPTALDPLVKRVTTYLYDNRGRVSTIRRTHPSVPGYQADEVFTYFTTESGGIFANLLMQHTDRNGNRTLFTYDTNGRVIQHDILPPSGTTVLGSETFTYLGGTELVDTQVTDGNRTRYVYDFRLRQTEVKRQANTLAVGGELIDVTTYDNTSTVGTANRVIRRTDPYGRRTQYVYSATTGYLVREVRDLIPDGATGTLSTLDRTALTLSNPAFVIEDCVYDAEHQKLKTVDGRGIVHTATYDRQGRVTQQVASFATFPLTSDVTHIQAGTGQVAITDPKVARKTEYVYDAQGNVKEVKHPRFFDTVGGDANGSGKAKTVMTYTDRNLLKTRDHAPGVAGVSASESFTYYLDRKPQDHVDLRGQTSTQVWGVCCGLFQNAVQPTDNVAGTGGGATVRAGTLQMHDKHGNFTWSAAFPSFFATGGFLAQPDPRDVNNATINPLAITTTRYDARHRPLARTVWQVNPGNLDPDNVKIAGVGGEPLGTNLTTCYAYDDNLSDGIQLTFLIPITPFPYTIDLNGLNLGANAQGSVMAVKNPAGEVTVVVRDGLGRTVRTFDGLGHRVTTVHDVVVGGLVQTTVIRQAQASPLVELVSRSRTDGAGRTREQVVVRGAGDEQIWRFGFDANGNQLASRQPPATSLTDVNGIGEDCVYDNADRRTSCRSTRVLDSVQVNAETYTYDASGNQLTYTDQLGQVDTCVYDARDRRTRCTNRIASVVDYTYDGGSLLLTIKDGDANAGSEAQVTTNYEYNNRGLLKTEQFRDAARGVTDPNFADDQRTYTYDGLGRLFTRTDQAAAVTTYVFDLAGRMTRRQYGTLNGDDDLFTYDNASRLLTAESQRYGNTVAFAYDAAGRRTQDRLTEGAQIYTTTFGYDDADRQTTITYPSGKVVTRTYTLRSELDIVSYDSTVVANRDYDDAMRLTATAFASPVVMTENRAYSVGTDTKSNLLQTLGATGKTAFTYTYDGRGRKTKEADGILTSTHDQNFTYDTQDRLATWNRGTTVETQSWTTLTKEGDWTASTKNGLPDNRTHNAVHEILTRTVNGVAKNPAWDNKGNLTNDGDGVTFTLYDEENRLRTSVKAGATTTYRYDALGRRVSKAGATTRRYIHAGAQVIAEYTGTSVGTATDVIYVYGDYVDEVLMYATGPAATPTKRYVLSNHLYSVAVVTDTTGSPVERYRYDAYGARTVLDPASPFNVRVGGSAVSQQVGHTGRYHDGETGLTFFRARFYSPALGRFISRDPIGYGTNDRFLNLYGGYFVPAAVDPSGTDVIVIGHGNPDGAAAYVTAVLELIKRICPDPAMAADLITEVVPDYAISSDHLGTHKRPIDRGWRKISLRNWDKHCRPNCDRDPPVIGRDKNGNSVVPQGPLYRSRHLKPPITSGANRPMSTSCDCICSLLDPWQQPPVTIRYAEGKLESFQDDGNSIHFDHNRAGSFGRNTPAFSVLAHELCGHQLTGLRHPEKKGFHDRDPYGPGRDPVADIENRIRGEHGLPNRTGPKAP